MSKSLLLTDQSEVTPPLGGIDDLVCQMLATHVELVIIGIKGDRPFGGEKPNISVYAKFGNDQSRLAPCLAGILQEILSRRDARQESEISPRSSYATN